MKPPTPTATVRARLWLLLACACALAGTARAQVPSTEDRIKVLTSPESVKQKAEKDRSQPPLEFFRSQIAPFDILPLIKPNHWSMLSLEMRSNYDDYTGLLATEPVMLQDMPHAIVYQRDARLVKAQRHHTGMQIMLPQIPREFGVELIRPEGVRPDAGWQASLRSLPFHQMLIPVLTRGSNDAYASWGHLQGFTPISADMSDPMMSDRQRYYRLVLPLDPERPALSPHPLTWTTISHLFWDEMSPDSLSAPQQQALLDWLHWGGQLILMGGATSSFSILRDSFLAPYLPADPSGEGALLGAEELKGLSAAYPPPERSIDPNEPLPLPLSEETRARFRRRYRAPAPIEPTAQRPLYVAGITPREGASIIPLEESGGRPIGVEWRVGRGRVLMLAVNPTDAALATWPGLDTFIRRVILRRPEETLRREYRESVEGVSPPVYKILSGPELTWFRLLGRDFKDESLPAHDVDHSRREALPPATEAAAPTYRTNTPSSPFRSLRGFPQEQVAAWDDTTALPRLCRDELERASGITIPSSSFVLKVILAYLLALVPLNWLVCRYAFGRREWAWISIPILALGFAVGIERVAAYDLGYDRACDEIDVVEVFGDYPRAHVSRFGSLYSTGRARFTIAFPGHPSALALPLDNGRALRGEDIATSTWNSYPVPALGGFLVQPRSLAMFRAEQMTALAGSFSMVRERGSIRVINQSELELRDAVLIDVEGTGRSTETRLGTIVPGASAATVPKEEASIAHEGLDPEPFLRAFRKSVEDRPENQGEIRLVGWSPRPYAGMKLDPAVDRHRGFSLVVVHLRYGPPPSADGPLYDSTKGAVAVSSRRIDPPPTACQESDSS